MNINEKLATIQTKFKSKKSRFNSFGKYNFRSAEDILEATKPFLLELGVSVTINEDIQEIGGLLVMTSTADLYDGTDSISARAMVVPKTSKPTLTSTKDPAFTKAQEYIKAGGKVAAIKAKYSLSQEVEQQLTTL